MARNIRQMLFLSLFILSISASYAEQLQSSQIQILLQIRRILNYPSFLSTWNKTTDFCNIEPTSTLTVVCYDNSITQLHIVGESGASQLPNNFSIDSFFTTLVKLPSLKVLKLVSLGLWGQLPNKIIRLSSLESLNLTSNFLRGNIPSSISSFSHLQTIVLDGNNFTGNLPNGLNSLSSLIVLSVRNNSLNGSLPHSLQFLENLRILDMSNNNFSGEVPDLSRLKNLQVLDFENNALGPHFPVLGNKIERIVLNNNQFTYGIPEKIQSCYQLKILIVSSNKFVGPFPVSILSLPLLTYIDISQNKFTGMLLENLPCNNEFDYVNLTSNLLTGKLPKCLLSGKVVSFDDNCLETGDVNQHPISLCKNEALAVGILPRPEKRKHTSKVILAVGISMGMIGAAILAVAIFWVVKKFISKRAAQKSPPRIIVENASASYSSKLIKDARYITQAMKVGALGLPSYRTFSLEELEEGTNNFDTSTFIGEGSQGQMYKGRLRDGSYVAIRCIKLKKNHSTQYFMPRIEMMSKLRHHHLVSAVGHCFEYYLDDSSVSSLFLVFQYVPNGTLRSWVSERQKLTWVQRISAATGVAKGIQFLHTGIVPGIFANNIKITDVLLDQNLVAKISSYNLPLLAENMGKDHLRNFLGGSKELKNARTKNQPKLDIYDFGVILLEVISGKPINSRNEVEIIKDQFQDSLLSDDTSRNSVADSSIKNTCSKESLKTMIEICCRCLTNDPTERPSIEDVLWNLQFAGQVQDAWKGDSQSSEGSPMSPQKPSRLKLRIP